MRRREFITLLGGAAAAWPLTARAQRAVPIVGFLRSTAAAGSEPLVGAFRLGLHGAGFVEGQNVVLGRRSGRADCKNGGLRTASRHSLSKRNRGDSDSSPLVSIQSEPAWSPVSTGPTAMRLAWSSLRPIWQPSSWGYCTSSRPNLPPLPSWGTRTNPNSKSSCVRLRRQVAPSSGKSSSLKRQTNVSSIPCSRRWCGRVPVRCLSVVVHSSSPDADNSSHWRLAIHCSRAIRRAITSKPAA
jgi:hypothetical protein